MPASEASARSQQLANALRAGRDDIVKAMRSGRFSGVPRENRFGDEEPQFCRRLYDWIDLLIGCIAGRAGYGSLLAGQTVFELTRPERSAADNRAHAQSTLDCFWADIAGCLISKLPTEEMVLLREGFDDAMHSLVQEPRFHVRTLMIGDCLMAEVSGLAIDQTTRAGVSFDPFPINAREPVQLARTIDSLGQQSYEAIFFSPFSHARLSEIEALLDPRRALHSGQEVDVLAEGIIAQTEAMVAYLGQRFECPIYLHNAALSVRSTDGAKAAVLDMLTARRRNRARPRLNRWLADTVAARNSADHCQFHIIDEDALAVALGRRSSGRYIHNSEFQHSTELSLALAGEHARRIEMLATLKGRKLVVCDLDNTLWDGVIGEGAVSHFADRQNYLRRLKEKSGVVLSIASKNDPANVHFTGGVLDYVDFVAPQISWGSKVEAVARIQKQLNLQFRHMVFVDDRHDERAAIAEAYPDVLVLDATDPECWMRIAVWADFTDGSSDIDRTRLYQEQVTRDTATGGSASNRLHQVSAEVIANLELSIELREAAGGDLKRFAELINRTNQWNLTGARTTIGALRKQQQAGDALLLLARVKDKFGDMGDVCAAVIKHSGNFASIDHFVLSCRVFGYGVETAMLDEIIRKVAQHWPGAALDGRFVATTQNHMARGMYIDYGFLPLSESLFRFNIGEEAGAFSAESRGALN
jgi:FkbH-like protein